MDTTLSAGRPAGRDDDRPGDRIDDLGHEELLELLAAYGTDVGRGAVPATGEPTDPGAQPDLDPAATDLPAEPSAYQIVPLRDRWLRIGADPAGRLLGHWLGDPGRPLEVAPDEPPLRFEEDDATDLDGWMMARADLDGHGRRWVSVLRRPTRESYVALVYDAGPRGPVRRMLVPGVYPDVTLCAEDSSRVAYVTPDRADHSRTRALISTVGGDLGAALVVAESNGGGLAWRPCSVRRFVKLSHGVRTLRVWDVVDAVAARPRPITVPGAAADPDLFDVAVLDDELVLVQAGNADDHWELTVSRLEDGEVLETWRVATGPGQVQEVASGVGCALIRVRSDELEQLITVPLAGFSTGTTALRSTPGLFSLTPNTVTPSVGFSALEMNGGNAPYFWYWDTAGTVLNPAAEIAKRAEHPVNRVVAQVLSDDGYPFAVDLRWRGGSADSFTGPVLLMVYGAYGLDVDLDVDRELGRWLDRGYAVGTPHVRGGGGGDRHLAGCRAHRDRSLADLRAAVEWLRSGRGPVLAERLCLVGASAGGFLAATALNTCPELVDACVIVNGYVDPLTSLLRQDSSTGASDEDEWGNPRENVNDLATLQAVSPVDNLVAAGAAHALVVVSGRDVRVNPRQGLKWFLRYRELGGTATLWYDPDGAHDYWGADLDPESLLDWVGDAMGLARPAAS